MEIRVLLSAEKIVHLIQLNCISMSLPHDHKGIHVCYNLLLLEIVFDYLCKRVSFLVLLRGHFSFHLQSIIVESII